MSTVVHRWYYEETYDMGMSMHDSDTRMSHKMIYWGQDKSYSAEMVDDGKGHESEKRSESANPVKMDELNVELFC